MYKLKKLSSGLKIVTVPMKSTSVFTILVLVGTGSKYETKEINCISHFLEHMFFKGTTKRSITGTVERELDGMGALHNAFTTHEITGYWVKAAQENFDQGLDVVSDILTDPLLDASEIEKEKGVIVQEIRIYKDDPRSRSGELFEETFWGDQPAGWNIAGEEKRVLSFQRQQILNYFNK